MFHQFNIKAFVNDNLRTVTEKFYNNMCEILMIDGIHGDRLITPKGGG